MTDEPKISEVKDVVLVIVNTDNTEGRGYQYPLFVCETIEVAKRLCAGRGVMGSDAPIQKQKAYKINNIWYYPSNIEKENLTDKKNREKREAVEAVITKAKEAGLSESDIKILTEGKL